MTELLRALRHELVVQRNNPWGLVLFLAMAIAAGPVTLRAMDAWVSVATDVVETSTEGVDLPISADPEVAAWIRSGDGLKVVDGPVTRDDTPEGTESFAHASVDGQVVTLRRPLQVARATVVQDRFEDVVDRVSMERRDRELERVGVEASDFEIEVTAVERDAASRDADRAGRALPGVVVLLLLSVSMYLAFDVLTKEKEQGTAETLLVTRVPRRTLLGAKFLLTWGGTVAVGWVWAASLYLSQLLGLLELEPLFGDSHVFSLGNSLGLGVLVLVLAAQVAPAAVLVAAWSPNYRAASVASLPLMLVVLAPSGVATLPTVELTPLLGALPIANVSLATRMWLTGELGLPMAAWVVGVTALQGGLALGVAAWMMERMDPLDKGLDAESRRAVGNFAPDAFALFAVTVVAFWFLGILSQATALVPGLIFTQICILAGMAGVGLWFVGAPMRRTMSLYLPSTRSVVLGVVVGLTMQGAGQLAVWLASPVVPWRAETTEGLASLVDEPLWLMLFAGALLPGVCEELLVRGALMGLLRTRVGAVLAVAITSVMFGLLHIDLARIVATGAMGVVLGVLLIRSGSIVPCMVAHFVNNAVALTGSKYVAEEAAGSDVTPLEVAVVLGICALCVGALAAVRPATVSSGSGD